MKDIKDILFSGCLGEVMCKQIVPKKASGCWLFLRLECNEQITNGLVELVVHTLF